MLLTAAVVAVGAWAATLSNATAKQRYPWNGKVDIAYTLTGDVTAGLPAPDLGKLVFDPPQARWDVSGARAVVKGAATLDGEWQEATEQNKASFRFFKVEVGLP